MDKVEVNHGTRGTVRSMEVQRKIQKKKPSHVAKGVILRFTSITVEKERQTGGGRERSSKSTSQHDELTDDLYVRLCFLSEKAKKQIHNKTKAIFEKRRNH